MEAILSYFDTLSKTQQTFVIILMSCLGFIILVLSVKRWLINR